MDGNKHPDPTIKMDTVIHLATTSIDQALEIIKLLPTPVQIDEDSKLFKSLAEIKRIVSPINKADVALSVAEKVKIEDAEITALLAAEKAKNAEIAALLAAEKEKNADIAALLAVAKDKNADIAALLAAEKAKNVKCKNIDEAEASLSAAAKVFIRRESLFTVSAATFRYTVQNISQVKDVVSPACYVRSLPWKILAEIRRTKNNKYLGLFVECNGESDSPWWSCYGRVELKLISHIPDGVPVCGKLDKNYHTKDDNWGFPHLISWKNLMNPEKGFVKDDTITVEAHIIAEAPHGV